jgi:hypothetical protein
MCRRMQCLSYISDGTYIYHGHSTPEKSIKMAKMHHSQGKVRDCCHEESTLHRELLKMLTYGWLALC